MPVPWIVWGLLWPDPKAAMKKDTVSTSRLFLLMVFVVPSLTWQKVNHSYGNMPLCHTTDCDRCWALNSHCFHIIDRDKLINPIVGLSIPIIRIPITKGGMSLIPNIRSWLTLAHMSSRLYLEKKGIACGWKHSFFQIHLAYGNEVGGNWKTRY